MIRRRAAIVFLLLATLGAADATGPTPYPKEAKDWPGRGPTRLFDWMPATRAKYWKQREQDQNAVVFVGDSLTENWRDLAKSFPDLKVANRGIGGDTSRGVLFRFKEDVLDLHPRAIVLLAGTNDLTARGKPADTLFNLAAMLDAAQQQDPKRPIILCTVPPSDHEKAKVDPEARDAINKGLVELAGKRENVTVCDLHAALVGSDGSLVAEYFGKDRLHLAKPGYERWAHLLKPVFEKLTATR